MPESPPTKKDPSPPRSKWRRWLKVLGVLVVLFVAFLFALNGPLGRWLVSKVVTDQLTKQGLEGSVKVEGRLWSGFTLKEAAFAGGDQIVRVAFDELGIHYSLPDLRHKIIRRVHGRSVQVEINLAKEEKKEKEDTEAKPEFQKIAETLRKVRALLGPVELDLQSFDVTLNRPEQQPLHISFGSFTRQAGRDTYRFEGITSNVLGDQGLPTQDFTLTWEQNRVQLSELNLLPELIVQHTEVNFPPGEPLSLAGSVRTAAAVLDLAADETGAIAVTMKDGPLQVEKVVEAYDPDLVLGGSLTRLQLTARNLFADKETWTARVDLDGNDLRWPGDGALSQVSLRLTVDQDLKLTLSAASDLTLEANAPRPDLTKGSLGEAWKDLPVTLQVSTPSLHQTMNDVFTAIGKEPMELANIPEGAVAIEGNLLTGGAMGLAPAKLKWRFSDIVFQKKSVPNLQGSAGLDEGVATVSLSLAQPRPAEAVDLAANWNLESNSYDGTLTIKLPDPAWIDAFIPGTSPYWRPTGPVAIEWSGKGSFPKEKDTPAQHAGSLKVVDLTLTAPEETTTKVALEGSYDWPGTIELASLSVQNQDVKLNGAIKWADQRVISKLEIHDQTGPLAQLQGTLPLTTETLAPKEFFAQTDPLALNLETRELRLQRLAKLLPLKLPDGFAAALNAKLNIEGTPANLLLGGSFKASEVKTPGPEKLPLLAAEINFATENGILQATGEVTEPGGPILSLAASLPLDINNLLNDPEAFKKLPLDARATIEDFKLQRAQILAPALADAVGVLNANVTVGGSVNEPVLAGNASIDLESYPLPGTPFGRVGKSKLAVRLDQDRIIIDRSPFTAAGGTLTLSGTVGLAGGTPQFDVQVDAESVLVWRDDNILARTNGQLNLIGTLENAALTGKIGLLESLVYKDIEIIPLGIPAGGAPEPKLPRFDPKPPLSDGPSKPFYADWNLDVSVDDIDPLLIRGNIATGRITLDGTRVLGIVGDPRPEGKVVLQNVRAALPLSKLYVREGTLTLNPVNPRDPIIDVRGTTVVNSYRISLYLFGPLSDPKYDLFSDPPLPQSEILTLIATGTTISGLQDRDTATMKAFQLGVNELKRRFTKPGSTSLFQRFLKTLDVIDIRAGEDDPFQGRKRTSASLRLNNFLVFSAAVDREGQTRGTVIFAPQPKGEGEGSLTDELTRAVTSPLTRNIKVEGLKTIRPDLAMSAMAGRLEYIREGPSASRANDAAFLLERYLRQQGFTHPEVTGDISGGQILLKVREGSPPSSLGGITVVGLEDKKVKELEAAVRKQVQSAHESRTRLPGAKTLYLAENNATGRKNATALLNSKGFWGALVEIVPTPDQNKGKTDLQVQVTLGRPFRLAPLSLAGDMPLRAELSAELEALRPPLPNREATTENINLARTEVDEFYRARGYKDVKVLMEERKEAEFIHLSFGVVLGRKFQVDQVRVTGLERTRQAVVEERFRHLPGQVYSRKKFDDQIRKLFGTGAFEGITLAEKEQPGGTIDVTLHFRETKPDGYQVYAGVGSFEGFILGAGYYHRNIYGKLWNLSTRAEYSGIGLLGEASVTDPFFLGYDLSFTPRAFIQTRTFEGYKKFESGLGAQLAWDVTDHYKMILDWTSSLVTVSSDGLPEFELGPNTYYLNVLGLTQVYDKRNDISVPTDGYYASLTTDVGLSLGEGSVSFLRAEAQASVYESVTKKSHLALGARAGVIVPSVSGSDLPVDLRYFLGGANSVRSFPARELGPEAFNGVPRGGESYWVANAEFIHSIVGPLNGVLFLDAGSLSRDHFEMFSGDIKYALGLGLRLDLPIGPVRLEYGRSLNPQGGDPDGAFHFAIGVTF